MSRNDDIQAFSKNKSPLDVTYKDLESIQKNNLGY